jgi:hypothetical protein
MTKAAQPAQAMHLATSSLRPRPMSTAGILNRTAKAPARTDRRLPRSSGSE